MNTFLSITTTQSLTYLINLTMFPLSDFCTLPCCMFEFIYHVCNGIAVQTGHFAYQQESLTSSFPAAYFVPSFAPPLWMDFFTALEEWTVAEIPDWLINEKVLKSDKELPRKGIEQTERWFLSSGSRKGTFTFQARVLAHQGRFCGDDSQLSEQASDKN